MYTMRSVLLLLSTLIFTNNFFTNYCYSSEIQPNTHTSRSEVSDYSSPTDITKITSMDLSKTKFSDTEILAFLSKLKVKHLRLRDIEVTPPSESKSDYPLCESVESIDLSGCNIFINKIARFLNAFSNLKHLRLDNSYIINLPNKESNDFPNNQLLLTKIERLDLSNTRSIEFKNFLDLLSAMPNLQYLKWGHVSIPLENQDISNLEYQPNKLKCLDLRGTILPETSWCLKLLALSPELKCLHTTDSVINKDNEKLIEGISKLTKLECLDMYCNSFSGISDESLMKLENLVNLKYLDMNAIGLKGNLVLKSLRGMTKLERLSLRHMSIKSEHNNQDQLSYDDLPKLENIEDLNLPSLDVDDFMVIYHLLTPMKNLKKLSCSHLKISDNNIGSLISLLSQLQELSSFALSETDIGHSGIKKIFRKLMEKGSICSFKFKNNQIGNDGFIDILESILHNEHGHSANITKFCLSEERTPPIKKKYVEILLDILSNFPNIKEIDLMDIAVSTYPMNNNKDEKIEILDYIKQFFDNKDSMSVPVLLKIFDIFDADLVKEKLGKQWVNILCGSQSSITYAKDFH